MLMSRTRHLGPKVLALVVLIGFGCGQNDDSGSNGSAQPTPTGGVGPGATVDSGSGGSERPAPTGGAGSGGLVDAGTQPSLGGGGTSAAGASSTDAAVTGGTAGVAEPDGGVAAAWPDGKYIAIDEVHDRLAAGDPEMLLINVVDTEFYNLGHLEGSLKITWDTLADHLDEVDPSRHIVIYCRRGVRSEPAYDTLTSNGYSLVWVMEGGIEAWTAAGYPTVAD